MSNRYTPDELTAARHGELLSEHEFRGERLVALHIEVKRRDAQIADLKAQLARLQQEGSDGGDS